MTIERKIIFGLEDIKALIFECISCLSRVSIPPQSGDKSTHIPSKCPQCQQVWSPLDVNQYDSVVSPFVNLTMAIERLRKFTPETLQKAGFRMLLEFQEPKV